MLGLMILVLSQQQNPAELNEQQSSAREWWSQLSEEEQSKYKQRHKRMEHKLLEAKKSLTPEEEEKFGKMPEREQRKFLKSKVRAELHGRGPNGPPRPPKLNLEEREAEIRTALAEAHTQGWLGDRTMVWLETASVHEAMMLLLSVRKWQFLEKAQREGLWEKYQIQSELRMQLTALPPERFFKELGKIIRGGHKMLRPHRQERPTNGQRNFLEKR